MYMNQGLSHPLDKLINDNSLIMLEAMVPFVDFKMKRFLIIYIKYRELSLLLNSLNNEQYVNICGFNCSDCSGEDMLQKLCAIMPQDVSESIANAKKMMTMMQAMNAFDGQSSKQSDSNLYDSVLDILNNEGGE